MEEEKMNTVITPDPKIAILSRGVDMERVTHHMRALQTWAYKEGLTPEQLYVLCYALSDLLGKYFIEQAHAAHEPDSQS